MRNCITSASLSILVNGSATEFFDIQKGLWQGDPLSPFLFNIVVNDLSCMLNQLLEYPIFSGIRVGSSLSLNHLQFSNDTLLLCDNDATHLDLLCNTLLSFLFASGLKINRSKSMIIRCNVDDSTVANLASLYGWRVGKSGYPWRLSFLDPMLEKLRRKNRSWSSKFISLIIT